MTAQLSTGEAGADTADPEPIRRTISGIELVTIPLDHYAALLECRRLVAENDLRRRGVIGRGTRIERDPELAAFLAESFDGRTLRSIYASCVERFGSARAPSLSGIQRFREHLQRRR